LPQRDTFKSLLFGGIDQSLTFPLWSGVTQNNYWGGAYAIQDDLQNFDDALLSMREARRASGMNDKMETPAEAEAMYLVSAKAVIALVHILDPTEYEHFLAYIGVEK
jgi:hypothetical protein